VRLWNGANWTEGEGTELHSHPVLVQEWKQLRKTPAWRDFASGERVVYIVLLQEEP
jgi:hypothetical protein